MPDQSETRILGLINARGGSKGVPRKNVRDMAGKPLIAYAIDAGLKAQLIDLVVVSTDDDEIAEVSKTYGAQVPFSRPPELASDNALQIDAIRHALVTMEGLGEHFSHVAILQPTTPLRTSSDIDRVLGVLLVTGADSVVSMVRVDGVTPYTFYHMDGAGKLDNFMPSDQRGVVRQDYPDLFQRSGAVYALRRDVVVEQQSLYGEDSRGVVLPAERSINIDSFFDWEMAEALLINRDAEVK